MVGADSGPVALHGTAQAAKALITKAKATLLGETKGEGVSPKYLYLQQIQMGVARLYKNITYEKPYV